MRAYQLAVLSMVFIPVFNGMRTIEPVESEFSNVSTLNIEGIQRTYSLYKPTGDHDKETYPLVVMLHRGGGKVKGVARRRNGHFNKIADRDGAYIVYPEAMGRAWDVGEDSLSPQEDADLDFIHALILSLQEKHPINPSQVFVTGMADGGLMAYKLACTLPDIVSAVAVVSTSITRSLQDACSQSKGISLMIMNGTDDPFVPYDGGLMDILGFEDEEVLSTPAAVDRWLAQNDCASHSFKQLMPDVFKNDDTTVTRYIYEDCKTDISVMLYRIEGGGHTWPGGRPGLQEDRVGRTTRDIDGCEEIWRFFQRVAN